MKNIYFVRHGESASNAARKTLGAGAPLTARGQEQSRVVAQYLATLSAQIIVTSPYERARDTALIIRECVGLPVEVSDLFRERRWPSGVLNLPYDNPVRLQIEGQMHNAYQADDASFRVGDEENFSDLFDRAARAQRYLESLRESTVVVVTHGTFLRFLHSHLQFGGGLTPSVWLRIMRGHQTINAGVTHYQLLEQGDCANGHASWSLCCWMSAAHLLSNNSPNYS